MMIWFVGLMYAKSILSEPPHELFIGLILFSLVLCVISDFREAFKKG